MWSRYGGAGRVGQSPYRDPPPTQPPKLNENKNHHPRIT